MHIACDYETHLARERLYIGSTSNAGFDDTQVCQIRMTLESLSHQVREGRDGVGHSHICPARTDQHYVIRAK